MERRRARWNCRSLVCFQPRLHVLDGRDLLRRFRFQRHGVVDHSTVGNPKAAPVAGQTSPQAVAASSQEIDLTWNDSPSKHRFQRPDPRRSTSSSFATIDRLIILVGGARTHFRSDTRGFVPGTTLITTASSRKTVRRSVGGRHQSAPSPAHRRRLPHLLTAVPATGDPVRTSRGPHLGGQRQF